MDSGITQRFLVFTHILYIVERKLNGFCRDRLSSEHGLCKVFKTSKNLIHKLVKFLQLYHI